MRLYLDSFNSMDWDNYLSTNLFYGITTNPLLAKHAGLSYAEIDWRYFIKKAAQLNAKEFHIQIPTTASTALSFCVARKEEARSYNTTVVIKIPLTNDGIRVAPKIKALGMPILMTACYHSKQYIIAEALKAEYIAPYFGRMQDSDIDTEYHFAQIRAMKDKDNAFCKVLVASIRNIDQLIKLAANGYEIFTLSPKLASKLINDKFTSNAAYEFNQVAEHGI